MATTKSKNNVAYRTGIPKYLLNILPKTVLPAIEPCGSNIMLIAIPVSTPPQMWG